VPLAGHRLRLTALRQPVGRPQLKRDPLGRMPHMEDTFTFKCSKCGEVHVGPPDLAFDSPFYYHVMSEDERQRSAVITADTCVIEDKEFFVRGILEIPVHGRDTTFGYGVWVSLSEKSFARYLELFESTDRLDEAPYFGWFSNQLPGYPDTLNLKTHVQLRPYPSRPSIELEATDHPLALEQRNGISLDRLREILEANEHEGHAA